MNVIITPGQLSGKINAVSSKSDVHRTLICAMLCDEPTEISVRGISKDITATLRCAEALGAEIKKTAEGFIVSKGKVPKECELLCGESGSTARFMIPVAAHLTEKSVIKGEGRLPERPFTPLVREMCRMGCDISGEFLPMTVSGKLRPGKFMLEGNISSQFISGLMFALPNLSDNSKIILITPLESSAYVNMTIKTLSGFGVNIEKTEYGYFIEGNQKFVSPKKIECEGDWSNAAFFLAMKSAGCSVEVDGINKNSIQGDKIFEDVVGEREIDVSEIPDLVPPLAVAAAAKIGDTIFKNAGRLRLKESDRLLSVSRMINSLGGSAEISGESLAVHGRGKLNGGVVDSFSDHRIVMAATAASVISDGKIKITGAEAADKSYPSFFEDFKSIGGVFDVEY